MKHHEHTPPELAVRRADPGKASNVLVVEISGDWLDRSHLLEVSTVTEKLADGGATALEFEAKELRRWDSALMVRILAMHDGCAKAGIEFRAQTLPAGVAKLIALAQAVPEKSDAARKEVKPTFLERVGESGLAAWTGGRAVLIFLGETVVSLLKLLRGRAQFRGRDLTRSSRPAGPSPSASWP